MRELFRRIDKETLLAGSFGFVAIIAAIAEMLISGVNSASIVAMIKDVFGTLVDVVVLLVVLKSLLPRKNGKSFEAVFLTEMEMIETKYAPIIEKAEGKNYVWNIASNLSAIVGSDPGKYWTLFEFDGISTFSFSVSKTVFMGRSKESFDEEKARIIADICRKIENNYKSLVNCISTSDGFKVIFADELSTSEDAVSAANIIDCIVMLYLAECKK